MKQAVVAQFTVPGMSAAQYDRVMEDLQRAGAGAPSARRYHVAAPNERGWSVIDVWDSAQDLEGFAQILVPILIQNGVTPPTPTVLPVHNIAS